MIIIHASETTFYLGKTDLTYTFPSRNFLTNKLPLHLKKYSRPKDL